MSNSLNAATYLFKKQVYTKELEGILAKVVLCYNLMIEDNVELPNDENMIRDILVNEYVNNPHIKRVLELNYFVFPEVPESKTTGRTDIRIHNPNLYYEQEAYYIIECKRLDNKARRGVSGLNSKYITNGIQRFTEETYSSYYKTNAMIGFVVEPMNINENIKDINHLLTKKHIHCGTTQVILQDNFIPNFTFHYRSEHTTKSQVKIKLFHLMLDFSKCKVLSKEDYLLSLKVRKGISSL